MEQNGLPVSQQQRGADVASSWWDEACRSARWLRAGNPPQRTDIWGPVLDPDEEGRLLADLNYSRFYGGDGSYRHNNLFVFGSTDFVVGALGVNMLLNEHRKTQARRRAQIQWRDQQVSSVVVTSKRLWCGIKTGARLEFGFSKVSEFIPDLDNWSVTLAFTGNAVPLRLEGPPAPAVALWTAYGVYGGRWSEHPALARLR